MYWKKIMSIVYQVKDFLEDPSPDTETPLSGFAGEATVSQTIVGPHQEGRVYFRGTWWPARCDEFVTLKPGDPVQVIDMSNITLLVEPVHFS